MPITTAPFVLKDVTLTLIKASEVGTGTETAYQCQLTQAELTPSAATGGGGGTDLVTFCGTHPAPAAGAGSATWVLTLAGFQAYEDATDLSIILFKDEGVEYTYELMPLGGTPSTSNPGFTGNITLTPAAIGGTAQQHATFTTTQPCTAKPTMVTV